MNSFIFRTIKVFLF